MFYIIKDDKLQIFDDNKEKLEITLEFMPQLQNERLLETDIITADELNQYPNKVIIEDIEIEIEVPDYEGQEITKEIEVPDFETVTKTEEILVGEDDDGNPIYETKEIQEEVQTGFHTETITEIQTVQVGSHKETITVKGLVLNPDYEAEEAQKERERIDNLTLTAADVERAIYQAKGMDFDDILEFVAENLPEGVDIKALKIELKANNFIRKHPYINIIGQLLGYTSDDLDYLFENKGF